MSFLVFGPMLALLMAGAQSAPPSNPASAAAAPSIQSAQTLLDRGQLDAALKQLDALATLTPEPPGVEKLRAMALYQKGSLAAAQAAFAKAAASDPHDAESMEMDGVSLFRMGKPAEAIPLLEKAHTNVAGANVDTNYVLGLCYMDTRRYDDARRAFASEYGFAADSAQAYLLAGRLLLRREYLPVAKESTYKALALAPNLPMAHELLGEIALAEGRSADAVTEFEKERALNPLFPGLYDRLGDAYVRQGDYARAQQALDRAVLLEPSATGPYILLGKVLLKQHNAPMAAMYLEHALKMDPGNYITHGLLGQAYRAEGRSEDAARETAMAEKIQAANTPKLGNPQTQ